MKADSLVYVLDRLARDVASAGHALGLNPVQWDVLRYLAAANRFSRSPKALTSYLRATKGTVSQTLSTLERRGLIVKKQGDGDRRTVLLALTKAGRDMLPRDPLAEFDKVFAVFEPGEVAALQHGLSRFLRLRAKAGNERAFGLCRECRHFRSAQSAFHCALLDAPLAVTDSELICHEHEAA